MVRMTVVTFLTAGPTAFPVVSNSDGNYDSGDLGTGICIKCRAELGFLCPACARNPHFYPTNQLHLLLKVNGTGPESGCWLSH